MPAMKRLLSPALAFLCTTLALALALAPFAARAGDSLVKVAFTSDARGEVKPVKQ